MIALKRYEKKENIQPESSPLRLALNRQPLLDRLCRDEEMFLRISLIQQSSAIPLEPCQLDEEGFVIEAGLELEAAEIPTNGFLRLAFPLSSFADDGSKLNFTPVGTNLLQLALGQSTALEVFLSEVNEELSIQILYTDVYQGGPFKACEQEGTCWIIQETSTEEGSEFFCRSLRMPQAGIGALLMRPEDQPESSVECSDLLNNDCHSIRIGNAINQNGTEALAAPLEWLGCINNASFARLR